MAYFDCIVGGSGKGNTLVVSCADDLAGATITCTNGTKTYTKTCPSTAPYEVTFYGLAAGTYTVSATVSGDTYTTTVVITDYEAELGGFNWKTWVDLSENYTSSDFTDLDDLLSDETAIRELMTIHDCVDYLAGIAAESADVEKIIDNDLCAKWINNRDYALDTLYANEIIADYMDEADKYGYGEWCLMPQVPKMTSNTAPYGVASAQDYLNSSFEPWRAFSGYYTNGTYRWVSSAAPAMGSEVTRWIQYKFDSAINVNELEIQPYGEEIYPIKALSLQVSNDGTNFTEIYSDTILRNKTGYPVHRIPLSYSGEYLYYRLYVTAQNNSTSSVNNLPQMFVFQLNKWAPKGNVPVMTSNTAPYGEAFCSHSTNWPAWQGFDGNSITVACNGDTTNSYLGYKFSNPICVKKVKFMFANNGGRGDSINNVVIQGSNDGTTWIDLKNIDTIDISNQVLQETDISNSTDYYLYLRMFVGSITYHTSTTNIAWLILQFYGRELSVSVPTMTSNTTPYGVASASSEATVPSISYVAYQAFSSDSAHGWVPAGGQYTTSDYLRYQFVSPIMAKIAHVLFMPYNQTRSFKYKIQGSNTANSNDWTDVSDEIQLTANAGEIYEANISLTSSQEYLYYQFVPTTSDMMMNAYGLKLQLYGFDYSEKEFETGTTKKWLYDHGVELVDIYTAKTGSAVVTKEENAIYIKTVSGQMAAFSNNEAIDLTSYNLVRAKNEPMVTTYATPVYAQIFIHPNKATSTSDYSSNYVAVGNFTNEIINTFGLDISAINTAEYIQYGFYGGNSYTENRFKELWLE